MLNCYILFSASIIIIMPRKLLLIIIHIKRQIFGYKVIIFQSIWSNNYSSKFYLKPFQAWICQYHLHPLQAANFCHNSRLVVDENDLKCVANEKKDTVII